MTASLSPKTNLSKGVTATRALSSAPRTALDEGDVKGAFIRSDAAWRNWVQNDTSAKFPAESGRYHLYIAHACPWAHRTMLVRALKGLEDAISVTVVHPIWQRTRPGVDPHCGWIFANPNDTETRLANSHGTHGDFPMAYPGNEADPIFGAKSIREVYELCDDKDGKYSVPILFDKEQKTIVSNESSEIIRMLNSEFNAFAKNPDLDLYPVDLRKSIDDLNAWIYPNINNGVYRCGFAKTQEAYDIAISDLTAAFDKVDSILQNQRFLSGDRFTEADVRLFPTILRWDEVYHTYFKVNTRMVSQTPAVMKWCREVFNMPGVKGTFDMQQIKAHYYCSHPNLNFYSVVPKGIDFVSLLENDA